MLAIMIVHFFATFGGASESKTLEMVVSLVQIGVTALSILSGMISLRWSGEEKGVDLGMVRRLLS